MKHKIWRMFKKIKIRVNYLLDRIIDICGDILMNESRFPLDSNYVFIEKATKFIGSSCLYLKSFPRVSVFFVQINNWEICFIGKKDNIRTIFHLIFNTEPSNIKQICRLPLWNIHRYISKNCNNNLVIYETAFPYKNKKSTLNCFHFKEWIHQVLDISKPIEMILSGNKLYDKRRDLKKAEKLNLNWEISRSAKDFDHFFHLLYLPFIKDRHKQFAIFEDRENSIKDSFKHGGLIMVSDPEEFITGMVYYHAKNTFYAIIIGLLPEKKHYYNSGINAYLYWCSIQLAYDLGLKSYNMGASRPFLSDNIFSYKKRWGTKTVRTRRILPYYAFIFNDLPNNLRTHLNALKIIALEKGKHYQVIIDQSVKNLSQKELAKALLKSKQAGLRGLLFASNGEKHFLID